MTAVNCMDGHRFRVRVKVANITGQCSRSSVEALIIKLENQSTTDVPADAYTRSRTLPMASASAASAVPSTARSMLRSGRLAPRTMPLWCW